MSVEQAPLPPCPECSQGGLHHSTPNAAWDECENGHVFNLRTYPPLTEDEQLRIYGRLLD